ncbi:hypothetical protein MO867_13170 [Microbulbifer sp. OS29]|uniref:Uncharacterized protein n=1 Tax=Microbulbifer okhotskensis TaxID=2926617 RepID=A0A9X2EN50_9GAMM|nr:hypothetical protein [Microbulbifer okhotskensis]MCO1335282.1 hypothetical protein [Microbulbifer okhotskensis]
MNHFYCALLISAPLLTSCAGEQIKRYGLPQLAIETKTICDLVYEPSPSPSPLSLMEKCTDQVDSKLVGHFRGNLIIAPEMHTFEPCDTQFLKLHTRRAIEPKSIWFSSQPDIKVKDWSSHFLIVKGELHGPGRYGHFGMFAYLFVATEIVQFTNDTNGQCETLFYHGDSQAPLRDLNPLRTRHPHSNPFQG